MVRAPTLLPPRYCPPHQPVAAVGDELGKGLEVHCAHWQPTPQHVEHLQIRGGVGWGGVDRAEARVCSLGVVA